MTGAWIPDPAPDVGPVVARIGEVPIFAQEVRAEAQHTGARMKSAARERNQHLARELADAVAKRPLRTHQDFATLAKDPAWAARGVQYQRVWQSDSLPFPPVVGKEAVKLRTAGDTTPL